ncbi:methyltransferase domain-containing protein [Clostridium sp. MCC353]|uniref:CheR family methyltransferase n=1 Tax=Clostridium sp. MCC353 TaxID=2592646 RepID=UPI001C028DE7|nr:protein-glutamate O-methyltransferase CheR [Clostridium sp. MCC353]MBT9777823.1 methyltransferase domain-containing protein [Clostridium sp. MCC353]
MIRLSDREFEYIVHYVKEIYGIALEKKRVLIECRLNRELDKCGADSFSAYFRMVERDKSGKMGEEMIHRLTTHYTYFLREPQHFDFIRDKILPEVEKNGPRECYYIWCAGCATGEECYTLAMVLKDYESSGGRLPPYQIVATDISEKVLEQARKGCYPVKEMKGFPVSWQKKYCTVLGDGTFRLDGSLREKIQFRNQNLQEAPHPVRKYDLVLCRNVMIYFDADVRQKIVRSLEDSLRKGGYLLVGHSELLSRGNTTLECAGPAVYKKE